MEMQELNLLEILKEKGIKPSAQRVEILEYLRTELCHPTIDTIYQSLNGKVPTLSKATVYNTLNLFEEKGLVKRLNIEGNEVRYDFNTRLHAHFKCTHCGKVTDIGVITLRTEMDEAGIADVIFSEEISFRGVCSECAGHRLEKKEMHHV